MKDIDIEREQVACVFGLGGGELHVADDRFPDEWDGLLAYWYDGVPEYVSASEPGIDPDDDVRTAIHCCMFGYPDAPEGWVQVASFTSSGERECWWCAEGAGDGTGSEEARGDCQLCEGDGVVYLGEGWCEVVYIGVMCKSVGTAMECKPRRTPGPRSSIR